MPCSTRSEPELGAAAAPEALRARLSSPPQELAEHRVLSRGLLALVVGHFAVDCCAGIWPVYKTVAHLDIALAGLIATVGSMAGNGLQLAFGSFADRGGRRRLLVAGVAAAATVTFVPWVRHSYLAMAALVLAGQVGSAAFHPSAAGAVTTIAPRRAGLMLGVFLAGGFLGYSLSQFLFTAVYAAAPLSTPLIALLPFGAAAAIAVAVPAGAHGGERRVLGWRFLRGSLAPLSPLFAVQVCASAVNTTLIFLIPDLLHERRAAEWLVQGGGHFALVAGGCLALLPAGHLSDRWGARRVLALGNLVSGVLLAWLLWRHTATPFDLLLVLGFGAFNGVNSVVAVSEGGRVLPGHASAVSALLMGMPWCVAALGPVIAGVLAAPARGGTAGAALGWFALLVPLAVVASFFVRPRAAAPHGGSPR